MKSNLVSHVGPKGWTTTSLRVRSACVLSKGTPRGRQCRQFTGPLYVAQSRLQRSSTTPSRLPDEPQQDAADSIQPSFARLARQQAHSIRHKRSPLTQHLSSDGTALQTRIRTKQEDPAAILRDRIANDTLDMETASPCTVELCELMEDHSTEQRRVLQSFDKLSGSLLIWLWKRDERWVPVFTERELKRFQRSLCFLLAAEGLDNYVLKLLDTTISDDAAAKIAPGGQDQWRGHTLNSVIKAHIRLSRNRGIDAAIDLFARVEKVRHGAKKSKGPGASPIATMKMGPSMRSLTSALCSGKAARTSPKDIGHLMRAWEHRHLHESSWNLARLHLHHPTKPNADHVLAHFQRDDPSVSPDAIVPLLEQDARFKDSVRQILSYAIRLLNHQGRSNDALWLESYFTKLFRRAELQQDRVMRRGHYMLWQSNEYLRQRQEARGQETAIDSVNDAKT